MSDWEDAPNGGWEEAPSKPVRFMDEPNWLEKQLSKVELPAFLDNLRGSALYRGVQGMADPVVGAVQLAANALPDSTGAGDAVNRRIAEVAGQRESARAARGDEGEDFARVVGNVLSPANLLLARAMPAAAASNFGRAGQGAAFGGVGAALAPVEDASKGYWREKGQQVGGGVLAGAILGPVLGAIGDRAVRMLSRGGPQAAASADDAISAALKDVGQTLEDIPPTQLQALRSQVSQALGRGQQLDAAALARKADFESLDMQPLLGQITREPMQFAREQNLRGVEGAGEKITARLQDQGSKLQGHLAAPAAGAKDAYNAGTQISESLHSTDEALRKHVSALYKEARNSAGKDLNVPLSGLAQDYARIVSDFADNVPSAIRAKFNALGLDPINPSNQRKVFTFEGANELLQTINKNDPGRMNPPISAALGELRSAVKAAIVGADQSGGPFTPAVKAAAERFKMHDAVPALKAAAQGSVAPDDFVRRFIVGGKTNDVKGLAQVLKQADPEAYNEARAQLGDALKRAAFGENATGDAPFAASRYMETLRRIGVDKLSAFFSADEMAKLMTVGRVGAYVKQAPNAAAVNNSNTASTVMNLASKIPGVGPLVAVGNKVAGSVKDNAAARRSLAAQVPTSQVPLSQMQRNYLAYLLSLGAVEGGGLAAGAIGQ